MMHDGLALLESRVASDLARIAHPRAPWLEPRKSPDGKPAYDVVVVGGGQSGLATAFGLLRSMVTNIVVLDQASAGFEGPWRTYARMHTLRSPKEFTGPDLDIPSLTYQSWHEARFGAESWKALDMIPKELWADYLAWYAHVTRLPVRNEAQVTEISADGDLLRIIVKSPPGEEILLARKVVLATGQEGMGHWVIPEPFASLPATHRTHAAETIDFTKLKGRRVAIIGAGASAFDNAATALEAGASEVHLLCRRAKVQVVQPYRWLTFRGFLRHLGDLDDAWRWRFMQKILSMREGFTQAAYDRCAKHANFSLKQGAPVLSARFESGTVVLQLPSSDLAVDFVITATGIDTDFALKPELRHLAGNIARWADRYQPPEGEQDDRLSRFPYLSDSYALTEREPGKTPWLRNVHVFSIASTMSFGASGSSINAMTTAIPRLVAGITRDLFSDDVERHWAALQAYDLPQAVVRD
jgi:cation diffusion facilitator CzcD-associated flavoprotein CzcO